jgi:hypothetical protein
LLLWIVFKFGKYTASVTLDKQCHKYIAVPISFQSRITLEVGRVFPKGFPLRLPNHLCPISPFNLVQMRLQRWHSMGEFIRGISKAVFQPHSEIEEWS